MLVQYVVRAAIVPLLNPDDRLEHLRRVYSDMVNTAIDLAIKSGRTSLAGNTHVYHALRRKYPGIHSVFACTAYKYGIEVVRSWRKRKRKGMHVEPRPVFKGGLIHLHKELFVLHPDGTFLLRIYPNYPPRKYHLGLTKQARRYLQDGWELREPDILFRDGRVFVVLPFRRPVEMIAPADVIGVDVNENNITVAGGDTAVMYITHEREIRTAYFLKRRRIMTKIVGRRSKRRKALLAKYGKREKERMRQIYYAVAQEIVRLAVETKSALAVENLKHIKRRVAQYTREMSGRLHRWGARTFQRILKEVALTHGVPVVEVNPARTSTLCPVCGQRMRESPKGHRVLVCPACGFEAPRDVVGAMNIRRRGLQKMGGPALCPDRPAVTPVGCERGIHVGVAVVDALDLMRVRASTTVAPLDGLAGQRTAQLEAIACGDEKMETGFRLHRGDEKMETGLKNKGMSTIEHR